MKKLVGLTAIILLFSLTITAQERKERVRNRVEFTSEQQATLQAKKMALHLDLDENQQKAVYKLMKKNADERQKKRDDFKQKKQNGVQLTNDEKFQLQNDRLDRQLEHKAAMKKILTKEQFEKWENSSRAKMSNSKKRMGKAGRGNERVFRNKEQPRQQLKNRN